MNDETEERDAETRRRNETQGGKGRRFDMGAVSPCSSLVPFRLVRYAVSRLIRSLRSHFVSCLVLRCHPRLFFFSSGVLWGHCG